MDGVMELAGNTYLEMLAALATAMGGWKGIAVVVDKVNARKNNSRGTKRAVEELEAKLLPYMIKEADACERISEGVDKLLAAQQQSNMILSEIKGQLSK